MKTTVNHKLASKYVVSGVSAFLVEYSFFVAIYHLHHAILLANTLSFCAGLVVSFFAQKFWTFRDRGRAYERKSSHQLMLFAALSFVNLAISTGAIELLKTIGLTALISKICVMVIVALWNFVVFKNGIFRKANN